MNFLFSYKALKMLQLFIVPREVMRRSDHHEGYELIDAGLDAYDNLVNSIITGYLWVLNNECNLGRMVFVKAGMYE